jgi:hypothetical protein
MIAIDKTRHVFVQPAADDLIGFHTLGGADVVANIGNDGLRRAASRGVDRGQEIVALYGYHSASPW